MTVVKKRNPKVNVSFKMGTTNRSYEGDVVVGAIITSDEDKRTTVRTERIGNLADVPDGMNLCTFLAAVELLQVVAKNHVNTACVVAAKAALQAIDDSDPTKTCPICGRKPRKDSDKAIWGADNVLIACERCSDKVKDGTTTA